MCSRSLPGSRAGERPKAPITVDSSASRVLLNRLASGSLLVDGLQRLLALAARLASAPSSAATCAWPR